MHFRLVGYLCVCVSQQSPVQTPLITWGPAGGLTFESVAIVYKSALHPLQIK